MQTWMMWWGGSSYAAPDPQRREDVEAFPSLRAAVDAFAARTHFDPYYPCADPDAAEGEGPEAHLFFADPFGSGDAYPDRIASFGPRGGVRVTEA